MPKSKEEISDHLSAILKDLAKENMALLNFIESLNQSMKQEKASIEDSIE